MQGLYDVFDKRVSPKGRRLVNHVSRSMPEIESTDWFYVHCTRAIAFLDYAGSEAANQILEDRVDWNAIGRHITPLLGNDPDWAAYMCVDLVCARANVSNKVRRLLDVSFGRIARKECGRDVKWGINRDFRFAIHIVDWLKSAVVHNEAWLQNTDTRGRPKKLLKFGSMEALTAEADRQMSRRLARQRSLSLGSLDEAVIATGEGYRIIRLMTRQSLEMESHTMRHCIGLGAYDQALTDPDCQLLSLRSDDGVPHGTLEVRNNVVVQFRGRANSEPKTEYRKAAERLLPDVEWRFTG